MRVELLDGCLSVSVFFESRDSEFADNICLSFLESCAEEEKVFKADETNLFFTVKEARLLAHALLLAADESAGPEGD